MNFPDDWMAKARPRLPGLVRYFVSRRRPPSQSLIENVARTCVAKTHLEAAHLASVAVNEEMLAAFRVNLGAWLTSTGHCAVSIVRAAYCLLLLVPVNFFHRRRAACAACCSVCAACAIERERERRGGRKILYRSPGQQIQ